MDEKAQKPSAVFDYIAHGDPNDELARAKAEAEYALGALGSVLEERNELIAERDALREALERLRIKYRNCARAHGNSEEVIADSIDFVDTALSSPAVGDER